MEKCALKILVVWKFVLFLKFCALERLGKYFITQLTVNAEDVIVSHHLKKCSLLGYSEWKR